MNLLASIALADLFWVCLITVVCIVLMIVIIILSNKKPKKNNDNIKVSISRAETKEPEIEKPIEVKEIKEEVIENISREEQKKEVKKIQKEQTNIEEVLNKIEHELESGNSKKNVSFEEEQEEKAIISYKELLKVAGKLKEEIAYTGDELEKETVVRKTIEDPEQAENIEISYNENEKKFRSSEIISPIYGRIQKEKEDEKNDDFLNSLKDLRKTLE
jgi:hypothetical protein